MTTWLILLIGMAIVIGAIAVLRVHPFVALLGAGLVIALLTPASSVFSSQARGASWRVLQVEGGVLHWQGRGVPKASRLEILRPDDEGRWEVVGEIGVTEATASRARKEGISNVALREGDRLIEPSERAAAEALAASRPVTRLVDGFGETCRKIGIVIAMASIIGTGLMRSGAAAALVQRLAERLGAKRLPPALVLSGFVLGIPVFFDTVFFLLIPLARAWYRSTRRHYVLTVMAVVVGATMAHSLVPPTPGPLFVSSELGVNLGVTLVAGLLLGCVTVSVGYGYALWIDRRLNLTPELEDDLRLDTGGASELEGARRTPSTLMSLGPIVLPLALLAGSACLGPISSDNASVWGAVLEMAGDKNVAISLGAIWAMALLAWSHRSLRQLSEPMHQALAAGGSIILITAAGGALGQVIRQTDVAGSIGAAIPVGQSGTWMLCAAFTITALVRAAQGSATVAMLTSVGIIAPLVSTLTLPYHPVYLVLAIGCGSKPFPWMNDSGFWLVGRMSGLTVGQTLQTFSGMLTCMGLFGFLVTWLASWCFPLIG